MNLILVEAVSFLLCLCFISQFKDIDSENCFSYAIQIQEEIIKFFTPKEHDYFKLRSHSL